MKNAEFVTLISAMVCPLRDRQMNAGFNKPLTTSPEILVMMHSVVPEIDWLRGQPLKNNFKNKEKKHRKIHSLPGRLAGRAKLWVAVDQL